MNIKQSEIQSLTRHFMHFEYLFDDSSVMYLFDIFEIHCITPLHTTRKYCNYLDSMKFVDGNNEGNILMRINSQKI